MKISNLPKMVVSLIAVSAAAFLSGCAMINEMANTPADSSSYSSTSSSSAPDPYYRGYSNDASAQGIK